MRKQMDSLSRVIRWALAAAALVAAGLVARWGGFRLPSRQGKRLHRNAVTSAGGSRNILGPGRNSVT